MNNWNIWETKARALKKDQEYIDLSNVGAKTSSDYINLILAILKIHEDSLKIDKTKLPPRVRYLFEKKVFYKKDISDDIDLEKGMLRFGTGDISHFVALGPKLISHLKKCLVVPAYKADTKSDKIRVLIVDDSPIIHKILGKIFEEAGDIEAIGNAMDAEEAEQLRQQLKPDVMTLDIHMPGKDGLQYLGEMMSRPNPTKSILLSSISKQDANTVLKGLELGAMEYVEKPSASKLNELKERFIEIIRNVHQSKFVKVESAKNQVKKYLSVTNPEDKLILIGSSTGGTEALASVIANFPANCPPTLIVQHIPQYFSATLARRLDGLTSASVKEAEGNEAIGPGTIFLAPGDYHMGIKTSGEKIITFINQDEKIQHHRPSVDYLFNEVVKRIHNKKIVAVILTGMGKDGADGMLQLKNKGAKTIAQDEKTSIVYGMPKAAKDNGSAQNIVPLEKVTEKIFELLKD